jgi:catechol 2,3-dioxygenase-like lactoylglutathione lyase family enzyme
MITAVSHVTLAATDPERAAADYAAVFGRAAELWKSADGEVIHRFQLANIAFEIVHASSSAPGLQDVAFEIVDTAATIRKFSRRGLGCGDPASQRWTGATGATMARTLTRLSSTSTHGVAISLVETQSQGQSARERAEASAVTAIDHLVVRSPNPERAIALYGARLGLDFALDRTNQDWGSRLLFFRCGGVRVEIGHSLAKGISDDPDSLSGLAWLVDDASAAKLRLDRSGVQTSEAKKGRRPGSQVLTVRSSTCDVPTIFLSETPREATATASA